MWACSKLTVLARRILKSAVLPLNHNPADALAQRGFDLLAAGSARQAVQAFRAAIAADASHVQAHHGLVRALRNTGRPEAAIAAALALTVLTPQDPQAHSTLSAALRAAGHIREAEAAATKARVVEWKAQLHSQPAQQSAQREHGR